MPKKAKTATARRVPKPEPTPLEELLRAITKCVNKVTELLEIVAKEKKQ